tara:strand:- start:41081 stop:41464 length:384 start_codon:yes stop_codon:yes gene_type:complete
MHTIPDSLKYTEQHEWLKEADDGTATVGITAFAQESLGDITFVELPSPGDALEQATVFGTIESVKAASDLYMPASGEVIAVNEALEEAPETVNSDPYESGWLIKIKLTNPEELEQLLDPAGYQENLA